MPPKGNPKKKKWSNSPFKSLVIGYYFEIHKDFRWNYWNG